MGTAPWDTPINRQRLENALPGLRGTNWELSSPKDPCYNCIAWAAGDSAKPWWPGLAHWPNGAEEEETVAAFAAAFSSLGFEICEKGDFEEGYEKVAIYGESDFEPLHMARQLPTGQWTSKLGTDGFDIVHDNPTHVECERYGAVLAFLRRKLTSK